MTREQLRLDLEDHFRANFGAVWLRTDEPDESLEAARELAKSLTSQGRVCEWASWDIDRGLICSDAVKKLPEFAQLRNTEQPRSVLGHVPLLSHAAKTALDAQLFIWVFHNWHRKELADNIQLMQMIQNLVLSNRAGDSIYRLLFTSSTSKVPADLDRQLVVLEHHLPTKDELATMVDNMTEVNQLEPLTDDTAKATLLESACGLTHYEAENAFSLSIIRTRRTGPARIDPKIVWNIKAGALRKRGILELYEGDASFDQMGGVAEFQRFTTSMLIKRGDNPLLFPRGCLLLGVPGSGKTQAVNCLGNATGRRVLRMRMGSLRSKYQGESDANLEEALRIADAMSPCVLFIDQLVL